MKKHLQTFLGILVITGFLTVPFLVFAQPSEPELEGGAIPPALITGKATNSVGASSNKPNLGDAFSNVNKSVGERAGYKTKDLDLLEVVITVIRLVLSAIGIIFIILIIYSGFTWMTAGGSDEKVSKSKAVLKNSVIGLVIIIGAYAVSYFVVQSLSFLNIAK